MTASIAAPSRHRGVWPTLRRGAPFLIVAELAALTVLIGWPDRTREPARFDAIGASLSIWVIPVVICLAVATLAGRNRVALAGLSTAAYLVTYVLYPYAFVPDSLPASWVTRFEVALAGILLSLALAAALAIAEPPRASRVVAVGVGVVLVWASTASLATLAVVVTKDWLVGAQVPDPVAQYGSTIGWWRAAWVALVAIGAGRGFRFFAGEVRGVWHDLRFEHHPASRTADARLLAQALGELLYPGRRVRRAEESERALIAAELHAEVLPSLRRSLAEIERGDSVERLAVDLREAMAVVDGMLARRRSIVLEEMGLVAGLEWLAERTEEHAGVAVEIDLGGDAQPAPGRPPRSVERAAFRIAQLAMDNAVRHAPGSTIHVWLAATSRAVHLRVADDGPGMVETPAAAATRGRRGIADMTADAEACGGSLHIGAARDSDPVGTSVVFTWPA